MEVGGGKTEKILLIGQVQWINKLIGFAHGLLIIDENFGSTNKTLKLFKESAERWDYK